MAEAGLFSPLHKTHLRDQGTAHHARNALQCNAPVGGAALPSAACTASSLWPRTCPPTFSLTPELVRRPGSPVNFSTRAGQRSPLEKGPAGVLHRPPAGTGPQGWRRPPLIAASAAHLVEARSGAPRGSAVTAPVPAAEAARGAPPCPPRSQDAVRRPYQVRAVGVARRPAARATAASARWCSIASFPSPHLAGHSPPDPIAPHGCAG